MGHVSLGREADCVVVAPATANFLARLAHGLAEDMVSLVALSTMAPIVVAPAMDHEMFEKEITQSNLETLRKRGVRLVGPHYGWLASGIVGWGRMAEVEEILGTVRLVLAQKGELVGRKIVVTAGGTREAIDPVRFVGNRSSGRMGYALASAALDRGASVVLVSGPTCLQPPWGAKVVSVESAAEMLEAVTFEVQDAHCLIMAAAVADFRPAEGSASKIKRENGELILRLVATPDILASINKPGLVKVGFAAETEDLVANALKKLKTKGLDLIVANDATATIGAEEAQVVLIDRSGAAEPLPTMSKQQVAERILDRVVPLVTSGSVA
jgi:phosphopantothenoylcysteine decarboxylase/phosphopantothenate--cysteine ligase